MSQITSNITSVGLYQSEVNPSTRLGTLVTDDYGRKYRYVKAGAVALVVGNVLQSPARDTQFTVDMAVPAAVAIGATDIGLTNGTTATTLDMFKGGQLIVSTSTGIGQSYRIAGNTVAANGAALTVTVEEPLRVALATSSKVILGLSDYNGVIVSPTTRTGKTVGVAIFPIPAANYGWIQTGGDAAALSDATVAALGEGLSPSTSTAGCTTKAVTLLERIGTASILQVSAKVGRVFLSID